MIKTIFASPIQENVEGGDNTPLQDGKYYGGVYNGRKYLYSQLMIETFPIEKLEKVIKKQIGYV